MIFEAADSIGAAWRTRWRSLVLFTPRLYSPLPGLPFPGDPDGYPTRDAVLAYLGWVEVGAGILREARIRRIDGLAAEGLRLLNFNVEAQCTPSHSALLTGRHAIRSGTQTVPITGGPDGLTRWEKTNAQLLSEPGYAFGMVRWTVGGDGHSAGPRSFKASSVEWVATGR